MLPPFSVLLGASVAIGVRLFPMLLMTPVRPVQIHLHVFAILSTLTVMIWASIPVVICQMTPDCLIPAGLLPIHVPFAGYG